MENKSTCHTTSERRLIDAYTAAKDIESIGKNIKTVKAMQKAALIMIAGQPTVDAVEVVHGRWVPTANEERTNYRWNVTAECSECHHSKGEVWAGFFPGFPKELAEDIALESAESVKLDNYCPNCGAKMDLEG